MLNLPLHRFSGAMYGFDGRSYENQYFHALPGHPLAFGRSHTLTDRFRYANMSAFF
jgi:hypothetical protein